MAPKINTFLLNILNGRLRHLVRSKAAGSSTKHRSLRMNWEMPKNHSSTAKQKNTTPIHICVAQEHDHDRLLDFIRIHFYPEEPLTIGNEPKLQDPADEELNMSNLKYGTTLMALRKNGDEEEVIGTAIAGPKDCHELEHLIELAAKYSIKSKYGSAVHLILRIERETNVFERFGIERVLHVHVLGVHQNARGIALGARLMQELMTLGAKLNYELMTVDCTSAYSARLCERLGMECINVVWYKDYLDEDGNQILQPPPPHDSVKTFAKHLLK